MINNIDYTKLAMSYQRDKAEIDPTLRSQVWGSLLVGLSAFWCIVALFIWIIS
ncbi:TPA: YmiA family putative membrane protein [Klebsiella aerogenes]|uniref:YmiA family putative membrane protein n=1 Tax=Klebsiella TaxID=570 RepID=UPI0009081C33|nr:YmiA family putative membrane protein [Klebsiella aerogenes]MCP5934061.1 YmiA family putative membrane protein [Klebsiella pneumoniae]EIV3799442.1 YmiA family putative membrane protein [Klebsiella aerogenes]EIV7210983.1 YmiA family putative membrane protein [Klebsiella aerogenes]EKT8944617.1 YmiA family putative membrane protein [Klebsiella aerogenes]EKV8595565.1 YmiA family putative membrane protein [Klebsiella aerogenes]